MPAHPHPAGRRPHPRTLARSHPRTHAAAQTAAIKEAKRRKKAGLPPLEEGVKELRTIWDAFDLIGVVVLPLLAIVVGRCLLEHLGNLLKAVRTFSLRPGSHKYWTVVRKNLYKVVLGPAAGTNLHWELKHMLLAVVVVASMALCATWIRFAQEEAAREDAAEEEAGKKKTK